MPKKQNKAPLLMMLSSLLLLLPAAALAFNSPAAVPSTHHMHLATSAAARPFAFLSAHNNIQTEDNGDDTTGNDPTDIQRRRGLAAAGTSLPSHPLYLA